jgi:hypothetical protein
VFENSLLRRIFGPKREDKTGEWRKLYNELTVLYCSPNIVQVIKSKIISWSGHVARMGKGRCVYRVLVGKSEGKRPPGRPGIDGRIMLRWIFVKWDVGLWTGLSWLRIETGGEYL